MKQTFSLAAAGNPELPPNDNPNLRWTVARKEAVILHILDEEYGMLKSREAALIHYFSTKLTAEELESWITHYTQRGGKRSLRTTYTQDPKYRGVLDPEQS